MKKREQEETKEKRREKTHVGGANGCNRGIAGEGKEKRTQGTGGVCRERQWGEDKGKMREMTQGRKGVLQ